MAEDLGRGSQNYVDTEYQRGKRKGIHLGLLLFRAPILNIMVIGAVSGKIENARTIPESWPGADTVHTYVIQADLITRSSSDRFGVFPYINEASRNILAA